MWFKYLISVWLHLLYIMCISGDMFETRLDKDMSDKKLFWFFMP